MSSIIYEIFIFFIDYEVYPIKSPLSDAKLRRFFWEDPS